eukprot:4351027-Pyramimonas_sp.AAC.1
MLHKSLQRRTVSTLAPGTASWLASITSWLTSATLTATSKTLPWRSESRRHRLAPLDTRYL